MKLSVEDGIVVCSLEDKSHSFLRQTHHLFKGFYHDKLRMNFFPDSADSEIDSVTKELNIMSAIYSYAIRCYGIEIDDSFTERRKALNEKLEAYWAPIRAAEQEQRAKEREEKEAQERWVRLSLKGCTGCTDCRPTYEDEWKCAASGDDLEVKNCPGYDGVIHYLFNYKPFPTDNCPFKVN